MSGDLCSCACLRLLGFQPVAAERGGVSRLPCGGELPSFDPYLSRHRCTKEFVAISEEREAGRALARIVCGLLIRF